MTESVVTDHTKQETISADQNRVELCEKNPAEDFLRMDRIPHIWCPGCGIGTSVNAFVRALIEAKVDRSKLCVVSGIGCSGRVSGYLNVDAFHTTHGRAIPFATGLKLANPELTVVVYSGDGDLSAIGGNHLVHAARRNIDIKVVCVNNFIYSMTGGQAAPTTPMGTIASTAPYGFCEYALNLPHFVEACGATYIARWTTFHVRQLQKSMQESFAKKGFTFIEVIAPCPTLYGRRNQYRQGVDEMKMFKEVSRREKDIETRDAEIKPGEKIVIGKFVDRERETWLESMQHHYKEVLGDAYYPYTGAMI
ncbi:MAG: 2-oxoacid:ferredoxin oxidoreductase subunit beta [Candidatus Omnitrophica bacterium]|nr:2-oxoacid:ferredoxin oxidoreductase subunit beta [Candidatus Omnitrophota bacterium]